MMLEWVYRVLDDYTMSLHLRAGAPPMAKRGIPGEWELVVLDEVPLHEEELLQLADDLIQMAEEEDDSFIEEDRENVQVLQVKNMRVVISHPPFSDSLEITIVKPIASKRIEDYNLPEKVLERLGNKAEGVVIAGSPGAGKSTFAAAIALFFADKNKIVKTIEKPRDLVVDDRITQYTILDNDPEHTGDILLLLRPDYVIFDEMRKTRDFEVFADMRLAGIGMVGVVHATRPIDAIQRFIGRVDVGLIPSIVDTLIFIEGGHVKTIYSLQMVVKVPTGFTDEGLARPVVEIRDFLNNELLYEMYSFGEQIVMMPISETTDKMKEKEERIISRVQKELSRIISGPFKIKVYNGIVEVLVSRSEIPKVIGKGGKVISKLEAKLGVPIDVLPLETEEPITPNYGDTNELDGIPIKIRKKHVVLKFPYKIAGKEIHLYIGDKFYGTFTVNDHGEILFKKSTKIGKDLRSKAEQGIPFRYEVVNEN